MATSNDQVVFTKTTHPKKGLPQGYRETEVAKTLNCFAIGEARAEELVVTCYEAHAQDARCNELIEIAPTVTTYFGTGGGNVPMVTTVHGTQDPIVLKETAQTVGRNDGRESAIIKEGMAVRRLTPRECERLQGFPDDWTMIPYRGKPEDQCPDGPRYKALGNSMAVPCMRWIGERIQTVETGD